MSNKKVRELRELSDKELNRMKEDLNKRVMEIRFKAKIEAPSNIMETREIKRQIARINTLLTERKREEVSNGK